MNCLTCNNKGIVPDMTSAIDGEGGWNTEICPDCKGESRYKLPSNRKTEEQIARENIMEQERQRMKRETLESIKNLTF